MWLAPVGAARTASRNGVFHVQAWPSAVDDALDAVGGVLKDSFFHALEDVWTPDAADGVLFLCDIIGTSKGGRLHAHLPAFTADRGLIAS
jgi:hypothetical protein